MMDMEKIKPVPSRIAAYLDRLHELPFVRKVRLEPARKTETGNEGLTIIDTQGRRFGFLLEVRTSYLDHASTNALIARARLTPQSRPHPMLLLARYVPPPTADRLVAADINFVDLAGNMHLLLGMRYSRTVLGRPEPKKSKEKRAITAAQLQLLFLFATKPEAVDWPVREMAEQSGVSKSKAALIRQELIEAGVVSRHDRRYRFHSSRDLPERLLTGYTQVLRPKIVIGRFQSVERNPEAFLERLPSALKGTSHRFALSGGPGADVQQHFYRGPEFPLYLNDTRPEVLQRLRLLPDREGPIILLRAFGEFVFFQNIDDLTVAPPWLIYAELMNSADPRAHEAAEEFRREFLKP